MYKLLASLCLLVASSCVAAHLVPATHYALQYEGRSVKDYASGKVQISWPGTKLKTRFVGRQLSVTMAGKGDHFDVVIDGLLTNKLITHVGSGVETYLLFDSETEQNVVIELVKRTENYEAMSELISIEHDGYLEGVWRDQPHILFIGDSISAGFGSESNKRECTWEEVYATSNARLAFPYQTGLALDASITQISFSGLGLIRNWNGNQPYHDLTYYADKASAVFGQSAAFEDTAPDLIVIEVGTNDFSTDPLPHEPWQDIDEVKVDWVHRMVSFVEELKSRYDGVNVILMPRPAYPYDYIIPATNDAIAILTAKGLEGVYSHVFVSPLEGCIWHPTVQEHKTIAHKLSEYIKQNSLL